MKKLRCRSIGWQSLPFIILCVFSTSCLVSCGGGIKFIRMGNTFPPYTGEIRVFWKEHGVPVEPYEVIGTVSGRSTWCGVTPARLNEDLHKQLINETGKYGGNAIILYCGEIGSTGACYCYGDIIRFKELQKK
jgi:hypothetical protein